MPDNLDKEKAAKILSEISALLGQERLGVPALIFLRFESAELLQVTLPTLEKAFQNHGLKRCVLSPEDPDKPLISLLAKGSRLLVDASVLVAVPRHLPEPAWDPALASSGDAKALICLCSGQVPRVVRNSPKAWEAKLGYFAWPVTTAPVTDATPKDAKARSVSAQELVPSESNPDEVKKIVSKLSDRDSATYLFETAKSRLSFGDLDSARVMALRAADIFKAHADLGNLARTYELLGQLGANRGDLESAVDWLNHAVDAWRMAGRNGELSDALGFMGYLLYQRGRSDRAMAVFQEALDLDQLTQDKPRISADYRRMAMVFEAAGKLEKARTFYSRSRDLEKELGNEEGLARVLHHQGRLAELEEKFDVAMDQYTFALEIKRRLKDDASLAATLHQIGNLHSRAGRFPEAATHYEEALKLEQQCRDADGYVKTLAQLAMVRVSLGNLEDALKLLVEAYGLVERQNPTLARELRNRIEQLQERLPVETFNKIVRNAKKNE